MNTNSFRIYYSVKLPGKDIDNDMPSVAVDEDISSNIRIPKNVKKQYNDTLLKEVQAKGKK